MPEIQTRATHSPSYWACQLLGWGFYGTSQFLNVRWNLETVPPTRATLELVLLNVLALALTHFVRGYIKRHGWTRHRLNALLPRILLTSVLLGLPMAVLMGFAAVSDLWGAALRDPPLASEVPHWMQVIDPLLLRTMNWSSVFFVWIIAYFSITSLRDRRIAELRQSELIRALQLSELRLLKAQLNPHFLFNCLNSVRALIAEDPAGAQKAVTQLARTLRYTLSSGQDELVTLERELEIVEDYLALESLRLGERLRVERHIEPAASRVRIPVMLLQTVVENAIKHGIAELPGGGTLRISASLVEGALMIEVENPRPEQPPRERTHAGIGIRNATERLRLLHGDESGFDLDLATPGRALARLRIPQQS